MSQSLWSQPTHNEPQSPWSQPTQHEPVILITIYPTWATVILISTYPTWATVILIAIYPTWATVILIATYPAWATVTLISTYPGWPSYPDLNLHTMIQLPLPWSQPTQHEPVTLISTYPAWASYPDLNLPSMSQLPRSQPTQHEPQSPWSLTSLMVGQLFHCILESNWSGRFLGSWSNFFCGRRPLGDSSTPNIYLILLKERPSKLIPACKVDNT